MKKLYIILVCIFIAFFSCVSIKPNNDPVIIRDIPLCDVSDDMTLSEYLHNTTKFDIEITYYVKEIIAQLILKCNIIDIRTKK